jgi:hypothetical protein
MDRRSNKHRAVIVGTLLLVIMVGAHTSAPAQNKSQRVRFQPGRSSITLRGRILGFDAQDYVAGVKAGQEMKVHLASANPSAYFVVYTINGKPTDMNETTDWSLQTVESGDYVIRVFMMRSAARRKGAAANYALTITIH